MQKTARYPHNGNSPFAKFRLKASGYLDGLSMDFAALKHSITKSVEMTQLSNVDPSDDGTRR